MIRQLDECAQGARNGLEVSKPRGFSRDGQGIVPVPSVSGSSKVVVLDPRGSVELLYENNIVRIVFSCREEDNYIISLTIWLRRGHTSGVHQLIMLRIESI
ncbi:hypothetical protein AgCh_007262 [Apium graveolens]